MPRKFAIFTDSDGEPIALLASSIVAIDRAGDYDENGTFTREEGMFDITTSESDADGEDVVWMVKGHFADIVKEIEACLTD